MKLTPANTIDTGTGLVTIGSLVFLLLLFFMVASSFLTPSGLPVDLAESQQGRVETDKMAMITITRDLRYYVGRSEVTKGTLEGELKSRLKGEGGSVVLNVDRSVPAEHLIDVTGIVNRLHARVIIATGRKE